MKSILAPVILAFLFALLFFEPLRAEDIPAATYFEELNNFYQEYAYGPGSISTGYDVPGIYTMGTADISLGPDPYVSSSGTAIGTTYGAADQAQFIFDFEIVPGQGGTDGANVLVDIDGNVSLTASGDGDVTGALGTPLGNLEHETESGTFSSPFDVSGSLEAGIIYTINMYVNGNASQFYGSAGSFSGSVDPLISIDPNFSGANDYTIVLSANATPEPSTWTMVLSSVALLAFFARRKLV